MIKCVFTSRFFNDWMLLDEKKCELCNFDW